MNIQEKMSPWKRFINFLLLDKSDIRQILSYAIFAGLVALTLPLGIQAIINLIQGAQVSTSWIVLVVLVTIGVAFQGALQIMQIRILENMQQKIFTRTSFEFAYRFPKIKFEELHNNYPPELANRFFDILIVQKGLSKLLIDFPTAALQIIFGLLLLSFYHPFFIIYGLLLLLIIYIVFRLTIKQGIETSLDESKYKYKVAHWIQEISRSMSSFKLSGNTNLGMNRNDQFTTEYLKAREGHFNILVIQFIQLISFKVLVTAGLLIIGGLLVLNQQMNIGQFVAAEIIVLLVLSSVEKLMNSLESFYDVLTSLEKIGLIIDKGIENQDGANPFEKEEDLHIILDNIQYSTPSGKEILNNINFEIDQQDRIFFDGDFGSGKTTVMKILAGIIHPNKGNLYINDMSIKSIWTNKYRAQIGLVLPSQLPFAGTIIKNITFGRQDIPLEDLYNILKEIGLLTFIKKQPNGFNTIIYPEGRQIPYSVSKRIVLARAIIHSPKLLLLKDPLEHIDPIEAERIIRYLTAPERPWALIVSSQNPLWEKHCNQMISIYNGKINDKEENDA